MISYLARYSPLLLSQIPPSRTAGGRWEVGTPLEIVLHCLGQTEEKQASLGVRLMTLVSTTNVPIYVHIGSTGLA